MIKQCLYWIGQVVVLSILSMQQAAFPVSTVPAGRPWQDNIDSTYGKFGEALPLVLQEGRLNLEIVESNDATEACLEVLGQAGGSSSSSGADSFTVRRENSGVSMEISRQSERNPVRRFNQVTPPPGLSAVLSHSSGRHAAMFASPNGLDVSCFDPESQSLFLLFETREQCSLLLVEDGSVMYATAASFNGLSMKTDMPLVSEKVKRLGIKLPVSSPFDETSSLVARVISDGENQYEAFQKEFAGFLAKEFATREETSRQLAEEYADWAPAIAWGLTIGKIEPEIRSRLLALTNEEPVEGVRLNVKLIVDERLLFSRGILEKALANAVEENARREIEARLKTLPPEKNPEIADERENREPRIGDAGEQEEVIPGPFETIRMEISGLISLTVDEESRRLKIDRKHWADQFGGKSVQETFAEVANSYEKSGLPEHWLNLGGGYELANLDYPQVLTERINGRLKNAVPLAGYPNVGRRFSSRRPSDLNRDFVHGTTRISLRMHEKDHQVNPVEEFFRFTVADNLPMERFLQVNEDASGKTSVVYISRKEGKLLMITQQNKGDCRIRFGSFGSIESLQGESFSDLIRQDEVKTGAIKTLMAEAGVDLAKSLGGPLRIENAVYPVDENQPRMFMIE